MVKHLALIMDGNRRWARQKGVQTALGHQEGSEAVKRTIKYCLNRGIAYLSLYTFSLENFKRSQEELSWLFELLIRAAEKNTAEFVAQGVRVRFVGDRSLFPENVLPAIERLEYETRNEKNLHLMLMFCYGARQEIMYGVKQLLKKIKDGIIASEQVSEDMFESCLWTSGVPSPDVIVRTGGHQRLSNFLLYQAAYSELYFLDRLWPDLCDEDLDKIVAQFEQCQRNFGV